ncbi:lysoplasmalogenase family protein [Leucobacter sp. CX87]|uniref:lysoplasmalogenase family protein n=1 Tax=unclassified Leucobacter TaxID=2621730 RepID=UPI003340A1C1
MSNPATPAPAVFPETAPRAARAWLPFVPYIVVSIIHVVLLALEHPLAGPTKLLLMPTLALAAVWSTAGLRPWPRAAVIALLAAIAASWLGDGAGTFFPGLPELPMMLLWFGVAHIVYIALFWRTRGLGRGRPPLWALAYVAWYVVLLAVLGPHTGALFWGIAAYGLVLGATAVSASRCGPIAAWGGVWFLASDSILAFRLFLPDAMPDWTSPAVMVTYTLGQGLIVAGVLAALRKLG